MRCGDSQHLRLRYLHWLRYLHRLRYRYELSVRCIPGVLTLALILLDCSGDTGYFAGILVICVCVFELDSYLVYASAYFVLTLTVRWISPEAGYYKRIVTLMYRFFGNDNIFVRILVLDMI